MLAHFANGHFLQASLLQLLLLILSQFQELLAALHIVVVRLSLVNFFRTVLRRTLLAIALKPNTCQIVGLRRLLFLLAAIIGLEEEFWLCFLRRLLWALVCVDLTTSRTIGLFSVRKANIVCSYVSLSVLSLISCSNSFSFHS